MKKAIFLVLAVMLASTGWAAERRPAQAAQDVSGKSAREEVYECLEKAGAVYYAYPVTESQNTPAPKGYKPFYVSHYGRHGSRYLISDNDYKRMLDLFAKAHEANALTPLGEQTYQKIQRVWEEAEGRGGDLSPLGVRQHKGIAARMYDAYPEVFTDDARMSARSTIVMRCALSMDAFCESLKEKNPKLDITRESSNRYMNYLNYHSPQSNAFNGKDGEWQELYRKFEEQNLQPERLVGEIFSDPAWVRRNVNPSDFMWGMYWLAVDMQNMETEEEFLSLFTPEELYNIWQTFNFRFYVADSNYAPANGMNLDNAKPLLRNILQSAQEVIDDGANGATLRFGHDGNLIPLTAILRLEGCYNSVSEPEEMADAFRSYYISPMAGNVQIVFFRNKSGDVLCKFMLNERDIAIPVATEQIPFYKWDDVKAYYENILAQPDYIP
ncbi:MAG: histidine phosphatase family protein [Bacteroidales bacterium]|nr:histidine phosphatase family protein [Bacteroidales bacterium]